MFVFPTDSIATWGEEKREDADLTTHKLRVSE